MQESLLSVFHVLGTVDAELKKIQILPLEVSG